MKKLILFVAGLIMILSETYPDEVANFKSLLNAIASNSSDKYFKIHCNSIIRVINAKKTLSSSDSTLLTNMYKIFSDQSVAWNASKWASYTERKRPLIVSWKSPTDNVVSLAWLILPDNWDPEQSYPLYVKLHGLASIYSNPIEYMIYYFKNGSEVSASFNNGYTLLPWARGNLWYQDISETDVFEAMDVLDTMVLIDASRKYLVGFSMGGFGTWYLGQKYAYNWAGLGIVAGALEHDASVFNQQTAYNLQNMPVYIVCGTSDGLLNSNQKAFQYLQTTRNTNVSYNTFSGGHEAPLPVWEKMYIWLQEFTNSVTDINLAKNNDIQLTILPNPVDFEATINYNISTEGRTELIIYNTNGKIVWKRANAFELPGNKSIKWNRTDNSGRILAPGVYVCKLNTLISSSTVKIIVTK